MNNNPRDVLACQNTLTTYKMHGRLIRVNADNNPSDTKGINKSFNNDDNHYINNTVMLRNTTKKRGGAKQALNSPYFSHGRRLKYCVPLPGHHSEVLMRSVSCFMGLQDWERKISICL